MQVLFLCNKSPYPPVEGGSIAMNALIEGLIAKGHQVKVLAVTSHKFQVDYSKIPEQYLKHTRLETIEFDLRINPFRMIQSMLRGKSYHVSRFDSVHFTNKLITILKAERFDIIQLETLYMCPYIQIIRKFSDAKIILRAHNTEHLIWHQLAKETINPFKKFILANLARSLERYEREILPETDGIAVISQDDMPFYSTFSNLTNVRLIPFGVNIPENKKTSVIGEPSLFHIGSMNWIPNQQGIKWFIQEVWPEVHKRFPGLKTYLAGRKMPDWLLNCNSEGIIIEGEVESAADFIESHSIMVVPLFSGSGIRIKIIEAMLAGKTVIATKTAAAGISYTHEKNILIANDKDAFIASIAFCLGNSIKMTEIGLNAHNLVQHEHDNQRIIDNLLDFYINLK